MSSTDQELARIDEMKAQLLAAFEAAMKGLEARERQLLGRDRPKSTSADGS